MNMKLYGSNTLKQQSILNEVSEYLEGLGVSEYDFETAPELDQRLPVYMGRIYRGYRARILGRAYVVLAAGRRTHSTPAEVEAHAVKSGEIFKHPVVFVFPRLNSYDRKRLVGRHIPFIVPGHQLFLPEVMIDLRGKVGNQTGRVEGNRERLGAPAQLLVLYHLLKETGPWPLARWAQKLGLSQSTMTRVRKELVDADLAELERQGRARVLVLSQERHAVWKKALPMMRSPVMRSDHIRHVDHEGVQLLQSGLDALSRSTELSGEHRKTFALSSASYRHLKEQGRLEVLPCAEHSSVFIESWFYDPLLLSDNAQTVDGLSLYLSLRENPDERVQQALDDMMESRKW